MTPTKELLELEAKIAKARLARRPGVRLARLEGRRERLLAEQRDAADMVAGRIQEGRLAPEVPPPAEDEPAPQRTRTAGEGVEANVAALNLRSDALRGVLRSTAKSGPSWIRRQKASAELQSITRLLDTIARADVECARPCCRQSRIVPRRQVRVLAPGTPEEADALLRESRGEVRIIRPSWPTEGQKS